MSARQPRKSGDPRRRIPSEMGISFSDSFPDVVKKFNLAAQRDPALRTALDDLWRKSKERRRNEEASGLWDIVALLPGAERLFPNEAIRLTATERVLDRIGRFVYPTLWSQIQKALREQAPRKGGEKKLLREVALSSLFQAGQDVGACYTAEEAHKVLRSRLSKLVPEALLAPGWRKRTWPERVRPAGIEGHPLLGRQTRRTKATNPKTTEESLISSLFPLPLLNQIEVRLGVEAQLARARLTPRESEFLVIWAKSKLAEAAKKRHIASSTARHHVMNALKKLRKLHPTF